MTDLVRIQKSHQKRGGHRPAGAGATLLLDLPLTPSLPGGTAQLQVTVPKQGTALLHLEMSIAIVIFSY